jgi:hypothetical protein
MAKLPNVKVISKDGEVKVSISLDLNINLSGTEGIAIQKKILDKSEESETTHWAIPDFEPGSLKFGNEVKE